MLSELRVTCKLDVGWSWRLLGCLSELSGWGDVTPLDGPLRPSLVYILPHTYYNHVGLHISTANFMMITLLITMFRGHRSAIYTAPGTVHGRLLASRLSSFFFFLPPFALLKTRTSMPMLLIPKILCGVS